MGGVGTGALGLEQKDDEKGTAAVWCGSLGPLGAAVGHAPLKCGETEDEFVLSGVEGSSQLNQKCCRLLAEVQRLFRSKAGPARKAFSRMLSFYSENAGLGCVAFSRSIICLLIYLHW